MSLEASTGLLRISIELKVLPREGPPFFLSVEDGDGSADPLGNSGGGYQYGRVRFSYRGNVFLDEECELDYFFSVIHSARDEIFSGEATVLDNSYFKLTFTLANARHLILNYRDRKLDIDPQEFRHAFREAAQGYYRRMETYRGDGPSFAAMTASLQKDWGDDSRS